MSGCFSDRVGSKESITFSQISLGVHLYKHLPRDEGLISQFGQENILQQLIATGMYLRKMYSRLLDPDKFTVVKIIFVLLAVFWGNYGACRRLWETRKGKCNLFQRRKQLKVEMDKKSKSCASRSLTLVSSNTEIMKELVSS